MQRARLRLVPIIAFRTTLSTLCATRLSERTSRTNPTVGIPPFFLLEFLGACLGSVDTWSQAEIFVSISLDRPRLLGQDFKKSRSYYYNTQTLHTSTQHFYRPSAVTLRPVLGNFTNDVRYPDECYDSEIEALAENAALIPGDCD